MNQPVKTTMLLVALTTFCFASTFAAKPSGQDTSQPKKPLISSGTGGPQLVLPNTDQPEGNKSRYPVVGVAKPLEVLEAHVSPAPPQYVCRDFVFQGPTVTAEREGPVFGECPTGYHCTDPRTGKCEWQYGVTGIVYGTPGRLPGNYTCPPSWNDELRDCSPGVSYFSGGQ